jgi:hypothetical protein
MNKLCLNLKHTEDFSDFPEKFHNKCGLHLKHKEDFSDFSEFSDKFRKQNPKNQKKDFCCAKV